MGDLDFAGLRADVETATKVPDFEGLAKRARRTRRRDRGGRLVIGLIMVSALVPAGLVGLNAAPPDGNSEADGIQGETQLGLEPPVRELSASPPIVTIRAIAGPRINTLYAAIDVCRPATTTTNCSLQVVPLGLTAQDQRNPVVVDELRVEPSDPLQDVTLQAMSPQSLMLSGIRRDGKRTSRRIILGGGGTEIAPEPSDGNGAQPGDLLVQLRRYGELFFVRQIDERVFPVQSMPELSNLTVVTGVSPANGWWVTGTDLHSGEIVVGVSKDRGASWTVRSLGLRPGMDDPVVATADGEAAYAFVRTAEGIQQRRSLDGGASWQPMTAMMPWPTLTNGANVATRKLGAVVRPDTALLVWIEEPPGAIFLESVDQGVSYHPANGPNGPIVAVSDGYVALGDPPLVSYDARTWTALARPATVPPD
jgi:hypothetical protein